MKTFIAAIPIFDSQMAVFAYRLCCHNSDKILGISHDYQSFGEALQARGLDMLEKIGHEPFASTKQLFVDVNEYQVMMGVPANKKIKPEVLVCVLPENTPPSPALIEKLEELKQKGYGLAYECSTQNVKDNPLTRVADYILLDFNGIQSYSKLHGVCPSPRSQNIIITKIPDMRAFDRCSVTPSAYFSGTFYSQPITKGTVDVSPLKINVLQLLRQVNEQDSDLTGIAKTIERDPAISISLLRFINSPAVKVFKRIDSIRSAVAILGQQDIKKWVSVVASINLADDQPNEVTRLSLIRARFAENLATEFEMGVLASGLFMMGLFSLLDVILQRPMEEAIQEVAVDEKVRKALVQKTGEFYEVLDLIYAYERADWDKVMINTIRNNIDTEKVIRAFLNAILWYKSLLTDIHEVE